MSLCYVVGHGTGGYCSGFSILILRGFDSGDLGQTPTTVTNYWSAGSGDIVLLVVMVTKMR